MYHKRILKYLFFLLFFVLHLATSAPSSFDAGLQVAAQNQSKAMAACQSFDPHQAFPGYTDTPKESSYYEEGCNTHNRLKEEARSVTKKDPLGAQLMAQIESAPQLKIDPNAPEVQSAKVITDNATAIMLGTYKDCHKEKKCKKVQIKHTCVAPGKIINERCYQDLSVEIKQTPTIEKNAAFVVGNLHMPGGPRQFKVDLLTGSGISLPDTASVRFEEFLHEMPPQNVSVNVTAVEQLYLKNAGRIDIQQMPAVDNHFQMEFTLTPDKRNYDRSPTVRIRLHVKAIPGPEAIDHWSSGCDELEKSVSAGVGEKISESCLSGPDTKIIDGLSVTRPCWQKEITYALHGPASEDTCAQYRSQGCLQTKSICTKKMGEICIKYEEEFSCQEEKCAEEGGIICNDGQSFCLQGDCTRHDKVNDQDFSNVVSNLSAAADASQHMDQNDHLIFKGKALSCRIMDFGFSNCCQDKGWGQDLGLASCNSEEKELGNAKEHHLAIYVKNSKHGGFQEKKIYCVFPSILARLIQEGHRDQFAKALTESCSGLTPEELGGLDFSKIDFHEFYDDIKASPEDLAILKQRIQDHAESLENNHHAH